jgi:sugar O-acyltransferase (sialic acid O-acetyltransferase NeuD family)
MSVLVLILGARRFSGEVADLLGDLPQFELRGFVENQDPEACGRKVDGLPVYWVDELAAMASTHQGICAFGSTQRRGFIAAAAAQGLRFITLVHPAARVSRRSSVGEGSLISPGAQVASHTKIGRHVVINRGALIGHDVEIGDFATIGPGANIAGGCKIGEGVYIGMGTIVVDRVTIGPGSVLSAGAVVIHDVPERVMVAGMPAVVVKQGIEGF